MKSLSKLSLAAVAVMAFIPVASLAQATRYPGYLVDGSGSIVKSGYGLCWHTGEWTPALAVEPCDAVIQRVVSAPPAPEPKAVVIAAAPLAPPPPPPPPVPVPMPKKISFSADALFAFDKAILKPEGKVMLDDLVRQLNDATAYDKIILTGHADRFGSAAYNQKLSERRANAVKDYMVSKNIPATRIEASGLGKTQPETKPGDCPGAQSAKVIACLQPDRRVDVEMTGTKTVAN